MTKEQDCNCGIGGSPGERHDVACHRYASTSSNQQLSFQRRVSDWMMETFSMEVTRDTTERNHRFLEEALELVQSLNCTREEAHMLVDYVFGRPIGTPEQEVGGVKVTLAALCNAADMDVIECGERELSRCWLNIDRIRAKQAGKPRSSPLPGPSSVETTTGGVDAFTWELAKKQLGRLVGLEEECARYRAALHKIAEVGTQLPHAARFNATKIARETLAPSPLEPTPKPSRDAEHCDYPDCEQHWTHVVAKARALLEPLADCDPAMRQWLTTPDLPSLPLKASEPKCNGLCHGDQQMGNWLPDVGCPVHGIVATILR